MITSIARLLQTSLAVFYEKELYNFLSSSQEVPSKEKILVVPRLH